MLETYNMTRFGSWKVEGDEFVITIEDKDLVEQERCVYAFVKGDEFLRIGSSRNKLRRRMRAWELDVTKALRGRKSPTPDREAQAWKQYGCGELWGRVGTIVKTPVGEFPAYLDEESVLIGRHRPPLNHSGHR